MLIKSIYGQTIIETEHKTMRRTLEYCAGEGVDLSHADLRRARLTHASLDGLRAAGACLWGADFMGSDMGFADLRGADLRGASFKDCCLAQSDLSGARLQGAYFSATIFDDSVFNGAFLSCPSFWDCDLQGIASMKGLKYEHKGEAEIVLQVPPLVVHGLRRRLVLMQNHCIWGNDLYASGVLPLHAMKAVFSIKTTAEKAMGGVISTAAVKSVSKKMRCGAIF